MPTGSYIIGQWFHPASDQIVRNVNPADTHDVIAEFPEATEADVRRAIDAALEAWPAWKNTPGPERGRVLWRAADLARARREEIARTLTREEGKIIKETRMVHVNEKTVGGEAQLPFGGTKSTGVGEREMAEEGPNFFFGAQDRFHQLCRRRDGRCGALETSARQPARLSAYR
jgi:acyl-CoA reductase-like NAD-dependent aldehyde dehydrogenase